MRPWRTSPWGFLLCIAGTAALGQWTPVSPGVEYREFTVGGPNRVFVVRAARSDATLVLDGMLAKGKATGEKQVISAQAARYADTVTYWAGGFGHRREVLAAVNGDFFDIPTGVAHGGILSGGWYLKRYVDFGSRAGLAERDDRSVFLGECVRNAPADQTVTLPSGSLELAGLNTSRGANQVVLYTPHDGPTTPVTSEGVEAVVEVSRPVSLSTGTPGRVLSVRRTTGGTPIPFDQVVLSGSGSAATALGGLKVGDSVSIAQKLLHYDESCGTRNPASWYSAYAGINGNFMFLKGGQLQTTTNPGLTNQAPRTALAYNATHLFLVVVDGRSTASVGMNMTDLGNFCLNQLGAVDAVNQDGGGSSTMWVSGAVKNRPSDGSERAVVNGWMLVRLLAPVRSARFLAADDVELTSSTPLRLGPGLDLDATATGAAGSRGTVVAHQALGVRGTAKHWWKVAFPSGTGWVDEASLVLRSRPDAGASTDAGRTDGGLPRDGGQLDAGPQDGGARPDGGGAPEIDGGGGGEGEPEGDDAEPLRGCSCGVPAVTPWVALLAAFLFRRIHRV